MKSALDSHVFASFFALAAFWFTFALLLLSHVAFADIGIALAEADVARTLTRQALAFATTALEALLAVWRTFAELFAECVSIKASAALSARSCVIARRVIALFVLILVFPKSAMSEFVLELGRLRSLFRRRAGRALLLFQQVVFIILSKLEDLLAGLERNSSGDGAKVVGESCSEDSEDRLIGASPDVVALEIRRSLLGCFQIHVAIFSALLFRRFFSYAKLFCDCFEVWSSIFIALMINAAVHEAAATKIFVV